MKREETGAEYLASREAVSFCHPGKKKIRSLPRPLSQSLLLISLHPCDQGLQDCHTIPLVFMWTFIFTINLSLLDLVFCEPNSHQFYHFRWCSCLYRQMAIPVSELKSLPVFVQHNWILTLLFFTTLFLRLVLSAQLYTLYYISTETHNWYLCFQANPHWLPLNIKSTPTFPHPSAGSHFWCKTHYSEWRQFSQTSKFSPVFRRNRTSSLSLSISIKR